MSKTYDSGHGHHRHDEPDVLVEPERGYETRDIRFRPILRFGVILVVGFALLNLILWGLYQFSENRLANSDPGLPLLAQTPPTISGPRLQTSPRLDLDQMLENHRRQLSGYAWIDQQAGTVRIPIDRAMDLVIERGLPVREGVEGQAWPSYDEAADLESEGGQPPDSQPTPQAEGGE